MLTALTLDPPTIVDDSDYLTTISGKLNLPDALKAGLKTLLGMSWAGPFRIKGCVAALLPEL